MKKDQIVQEIALPDSVSASVESNTLFVKGPKSEVKRQLKQHGVSLKAENKKITLQSERATKKGKKTLSTLAAHIRNMVRGCQQDHIYTLKVCSGHFPMNVAVNGDKFIVKNFLGEKVPRVLELKKGAEVKVHGDLIYVSSPSKEIAGQVAADIEQLTRRPGFDTRIFQDGIYLVNKDGKELK